ncbi:DEAD/DEAH box helicase [Rothia sp. ZJ1223]|uniref:DEAD/DEAH box helicase n=1 Tax=Rothia sp. ZJ1223 TaxID=2811098 RepID=UPI00195A162F|nr:DEAD/DEAH box helicase [Rothia sp. ZJ1223]MBM7051964.1 DEAD/DEAH box helicase [Rothia sp. ZJ1223]
MTFSGVPVTDPTLADFLQRLGFHEAPPEITHVHKIPARDAVTVPWPEWVHPQVVDTFQGLGIDKPYAHQVHAANLAQASSHNAANQQHLIIATGTASGKSLAYQIPVLDAIHRGELDPGIGFDRHKATVLYFSPTKALAADQLASIRALGLNTVRAETYDGDTDAATRRWIREHANLILCNPDMLHFGILPNHQRWGSFLRKLRYVVIDEAHTYRGVFGANVALLVRRLRRVCALYGSFPVFIGASATSANPQDSFSTLIGVEQTAVHAITRDTAPHGESYVVLWEPPFKHTAVTDKLTASSSSGSEGSGENGAPVRVSVIEQASAMLTDLAVDRTRTIAFVKSRRAAEAIAQRTGSYLDEVEVGLSHRVQAYRSGYLPEERRALEAGMRSGELLAVASTNALELGIDIVGFDAVLVGGWPGTRASFFQQIGRAGRAGQQSLAVFIASEDPLDTYLVHHPDAIFSNGVEATVFDPTNPYILSPHLCAAAAERPLRRDELELFGESVLGLLERLVARGYLRERASGWFWTHPESAADFVDLRGGGGAPLQIIEVETGAVVGTMGVAQSHAQAHPGAIYTHQGVTFLVEDLDEENSLIAVTRAHPDFYTQARDITEVTVLVDDETDDYGQVALHYGKVRVRNQVVSYQRKSLVGQEVLGEEPLDLAPQNLMTSAMWITLDPTVMTAVGVEKKDFPGALHAAEHAMIGLLPLIATCDRWDIGGLSTALHLDTEMPTIFVYDGYQGGSGCAERGFLAARLWMQATLDAIGACECETGCPSCVQSPKCGNRNEPLDKDAAAKVLRALLEHTRPSYEDAPAGAN